MSEMDEIAHRPPTPKAADDDAVGDSARDGERTDSAEPTAEPVQSAGRSVARTDERAVDPMAPGRSLVDPELGDAVEPNEPA